MLEFSPLLWLDVKLPKNVDQINASVTQNEECGMHSALLKK
jgi:hypothetical protein